MILTKTPLRMSYVGGGSDLPSYYREFGGAVLSTAINKYIYIIIKSRFEEGIRISYSETENVTHRNNIKHPLVRNALEMIELDDHVEIISAADIPSSGTGLGSSSSFSVGLIKAILAYKGQSQSKNEIANLACQLEIEKCNNPIGKQDQYAATFGGLKVYKFNQDDSVSIENIDCSSHTINELNDQTIAFYIGGDRDANAILKQQSIDLKQDKKTNNMKRMVDLVWDLKREFESQSVENFGAILNENWQLKRELTSKVSSTYIDDLYKTAIKNGATGGKLLGAGGGGFMIFHAPSDKIRSAVRSKLCKLREVKFNVEPKGSNVIFFQ